MAERQTATGGVDLHPPRPSLHHATTPQRAPRPPERASVGQPASSMLVRVSVRPAIVISRFFSAITLRV